MLDQPWQLNGSVALRPEPFGALAYDFTTRRLSFLKDPRLVRVVELLAEHPTVRAAMTAADVPDSDSDRFRIALERLASQQMITPRRAA
ncbi:mycofactocin biosynthesis chaperone MftB [Dermacoccaceae bacterium W4C1]